MGSSQSTSGGEFGEATFSDFQQDFLDFICSSMDYVSTRGRTHFHNSTCAVRLDGPADPVTGLQYSREITIGSDSPQISFHAVMKNATGHTIRWSVQSVTQYDTAESTGSGFNRDFWAFTPVNPQSAYFDGYQVRAGLADDPSFSIADRLFTSHWQYLENEVWLDSTAGWLAVADNSTRYAMIERFQYIPGADYPGKASVIF